MLALLVWVVLVALALFLGILLLVSSTVPSLRQYRMLKDFPGPRGYYLLGNALELGALGPKDLLNWMVTQLDIHPRFTKFWLLGQPFVLLREPEDAQILLTSNSNIDKGFEYKPLIPWLKEGLLLSSGEKWHARRKLLTTPFHFKILEDSLVVFNKHCKQLCMNLQETAGKAVEIDNFLSLCTLDVICESAMGIELGAQNEGARDYVSVLKATSIVCVERVRQAWLHREVIFRLSSLGRTFYKSVQRLHDFTNKVINERKESYLSTANGTVPQKGKIKLAFLDTLLEVEKRNPGTLSLSDMREEVDTFMFEGHDTTSAALNFYFLLIGKHPDVQERIYSELTDIFEDDMDREITLKDLQKMTYLESTVKEGLRIFPSVPYISRSLTEDLVLKDGTTIPIGTNVAVLPFHMHKNDRFWPEPNKFDPERFSSASTDRHHFCYIPFSAGPRNCIGQKFAMMELKMVAATVLRKFSVQSITKIEDVQVMAHLVSRPADPIVCKFIPRTGIYST